MIPGTSESRAAGAASVGARIDRHVAQSRRDAVERRLLAGTDVVAISIALAIATALGVDAMQSDVIGGSGVS